jgi:hypothetical protein
MQARQRLGPMRGAIACAGAVIITYLVDELDDEHEEFMLLARKLVLKKESLLPGKGYAI